MKKRLFSIFVVLCMVVTMIPAMSVTSSAISANDEWYNDSINSFTISSAEQLMGIAKLVKEGKTFQGKTITLANDINLSGIEWEPIGQAFAGTFNGDSHTISGLSVNVKQDYAGFFEGTAESAVIANLFIKGNVINSKNSSAVGGIVGYNKGIIINCGTISIGVRSTGVNGKAGGLVGYNSGSIINSYAYMGGVSSHCKTGGIVGAIESNSTGKIANCYSYLSLSGPLRGGIVGGTNGCEIVNCYYCEDNANYGAGNTKQNKNTYALTISQINARSEATNDSWVRLPGYNDNGVALVTALSKYANDNKYKYGVVLLDWESILYGPQLKDGKKTYSGKGSSNNKCYYPDSFKTGENITLLLGGKPTAYMFNITVETDGHKLQVVSNDSNNGKYVAVKDDGSIVYQESPFYWKNGKSLFAIVSNSGTKKLSIKSKTTEYYLGADESGNLISSKLEITHQIQVGSYYHSYKCRNNKDGETHTKYCSNCGEVMSDNEKHNFVGSESDPTCSCGLHKNAGVTEIAINSNVGTGTTGKLWWKKTISYAKYDIVIHKSENVSISKYEYSLDDMETWNTGSHFELEKQPEKFYVRITDSNGQITYWKVVIKNQPQPSLIKTEYVVASKE